MGTYYITVLLCETVNCSTDYSFFSFLNLKKREKSWAYHEKMKEDHVDSKANLKLQAIWTFLAIFFCWDIPKHR